MRMAEPLLEVLATHGEMKAQEFLKHVARKRGDYLDFYPVAALLHAGYVTTETITEIGRTVAGAKLGVTLQDTALILCQLMLPLGESFQFNKVPRHSMHDFPVTIIMTAEGYLRLDELE